MHRNPMNAEFKNELCCTSWLHSPILHIHFIGSSKVYVSIVLMIIHKCIFSMMWVYLFVWIFAFNSQQSFNGSIVYPLLFVTSLETLGILLPHFTWLGIKRHRFCLKILTEKNKRSNSSFGNGWYRFSNIEFEQRNLMKCYQYSCRMKWIYVIKWFW